MLCCKILYQKLCEWYNNYWKNVNYFCFCFGDTLVVSEEEVASCFRGDDGDLVLLEDFLLCL